MEMIETLITLAYLCAFELQAELDNIPESKETKPAITVCNNVVGSMYFEYIDLLSKPNNIIYTQSNQIRECMKTAIDAEYSPQTESNIRCIMLSTLIFSCVNLTTEQVKGLRKLKNKGQVIENHTRFAHRFRGQAVAMSKLETACFAGINIEEEKVKSMVIDFVAEINKTVCK